MSASRTYSADPGVVPGHTVYRKTSQREVIVQVGTEIEEEDIGQAYPRRHIRPVYETQIVQTVTWIAVPNDKVAVYEARYSP
jgi:hypothetical protein